MKLFFFLFVITAFLESSLITQIKFSNPPIELNREQTEPIIGGMNYNERSFIDTTGSVPGLTGYWDYVTNGNNLKKLWVMGDTVVVIADQTDSVHGSSTSSRHSYINFSTNGGLSWLMVYPNYILGDNSAYPDLNFMYLEIGGTVSSSGRYYPFTGINRGYAGRDLAFGLIVFNYNEIPNTTSRDIFSYRMLPDNLACVYRSYTGDSLYFIKYDCINYSFSSNKVLLAANVGSGMRYFISTNDGNDIFVMWWVPAQLDYTMLGRRSTDGGNTFGPVQTIMTYDTYVNNNEVCPWPSGDIIYKKGTNYFGTAFSTYPAFIEYYAKGCKIVFWSPYLSGYRVIVDWTNHPVLSDVNFFENTGNNIQTNMTAVSHPSLAYSDDGSRLFCVYSAVQKDSTSYHFLYNDIWMSYSDNNGDTWLGPYNLTSTSNADEIYPTISKTGNTQYNINITYSLSACPGSASFIDTLTSPKCRVYQIFKKCNFINGNCAGVILPVIKNSGEVPKEYFLSQNYPNPFNPSTAIKFGLVKSCKVKLIIYDAIGREIQRLVESIFERGTYEIQWNAENFSSGIYFYSLQTEEFTQTKKMILLK
jgi:hypothetical protein